MAVLRAKQGETLEMMVFDHFGRQDARLIERVLDHPKNKGLAGTVILGLGTLVFVPDDLAPEEPASLLTPAIELWS